MGERGRALNNDLDRTVLENLKSEINILQSSKQRVELCKTVKEYIEFIKKDDTLQFENRNVFVFS